jgi:hypothetical protein
LENSVWKRLWTCRETDKYLNYNTEPWIIRQNTNLIKICIMVLEQFTMHCAFNGEEEEYPTVMPVVNSYSTRDLNPQEVDTKTIFMCKITKNQFGMCTGISNSPASVHCCFLPFGSWNIYNREWLNLCSCFAISIKFIVEKLKMFVVTEIIRFIEGKTIHNSHIHIPTDKLTRCHLIFTLFQPTTISLGDKIIDVSICR